MAETVLEYNASVDKTSYLCRHFKFVHHHPLTDSSSYFTFICSIYYRKLCLLSHPPLHNISGWKQRPHGISQKFDKRNQQ